MTAPTNTITGATPNVGVREDLEDSIYRVAPEETPFTSNIGTTKAKAPYHEWQTETLAAASATNAQLEGDDYANGAPNLTTRLGNTCQILAKSGGVSRTQEVVDKAGRDSELARQKVLKTIEMKRDFEIRAIGNFAAVAESGATTRKLGGIQAFLTSNVSRGATGANGGFTASPGPAAATDGTQRTWTETLLKSVMATAFSNGGKPTQVYMGGTHKQQASGFTGIADIRVTAAAKGMASIIGAADFYQSDFGGLTFIPHAYGLTRAAVFIDPGMVAVGTLDGLKSTPLAKTGDSEKFLITMEKTVVCRNEKAHAVVADLT